MKDLFLILLAFGNLAVGIYAARQSHDIKRLTTENERLRQRLRLWLYDCWALYRLEEIMAVELLQINVWARSSVIGIKRFFRDKLRKSGVGPSPSERCTPKKIEEELAAL